MTIARSTLAARSRTARPGARINRRRRVAKAVVASGVASVVIAAALVGPTSAGATGSGDTVMHLHTSATQAVTGQHLTFYATVVPSVSGGPAPTGTVTFGGAIRPSAAVVLTTNRTTGKQEAKAVRRFGPGKYTIKATYSGDAKYAPNGPLLVTVTVTRAATTVTVTATQSTRRPGHWTITAHVRVVRPGHGTAATWVVFTLNGISGNRVPLNAHGNASIHCVFANRTVHKVKVSYPGSAYLIRSQGFRTFTA